MKKLSQPPNKSETQISKNITAKSVPRLKKMIQVVNLESDTSEMILKPINLSLQNYTFEEKKIGAIFDSNNLKEYLLKNKIKKPNLFFEDFIKYINGVPKNTKKIQGLSKKIKNLNEDNYLNRKINEINNQKKKVDIKKLRSLMGLKKIDYKSNESKEKKYCSFVFKFEDKDIIWNVDRIMNYFKEIENIFIFNNDIVGLVLKKYVRKNNIYLFKTKLTYFTKKLKFKNIKFKVIIITDNEILNFKQKNIFKGVKKLKID